jgi:hypothetical protein
MNNINKLIYQCFRWHRKYGVIPIDIEGKLLRLGIREISITRLIDRGYTPAQILEKLNNRS